MPIFLESSGYNPIGPDGQGRNRLKIDSIDPQPRCALRPSSYPALRESQDTRLAQWSGSFGICTNAGRCNGCERSGHQFELEAFTSEVMIRIDAQNRLHAMNKADEGWSSYGRFLNWEDLAAIKGWRIGRSGSDRHSQYILIHRAD